MLARMVKPAQRVGIVTADAGSLTPTHLQAAGVTGPVVVRGMEGCPEFAATAWDDRPSLDVDAAEEEAVTVARRMVDDHPEVGIILLECSLLPPYAAAIQAATERPVFDFTHLVAMAHDACARQRFGGIA
jgi:hypothetical protein